MCAKVRIEIEQELSLEREAFEARMTIDNGVAGVPIENVSVEVVFTDKAGNGVKATSDPNDLTAKFYIGRRRIGPFLRVFRAVPRPRSLG